jgi:hypothetical protein
MLTSIVNENVETTWTLLHYLESFLNGLITAQINLKQFDGVHCTQGFVLNSLERFLASL